MTFASVLLLSILLFIAEHPYYSVATIADTKDSGYLAMVWLVFITGSTVGYGGIIPKTFLGRLIVIVVIVFGTFLMSLP